MDNDQALWRKQNLPCKEKTKVANQRDVRCGHSYIMVSVYISIYIDIY